jgi:hypothetical protein
VDVVLVLLVDVVLVLLVDVVVVAATMKIIS